MKNTKVTVVAGTNRRHSLTAAVAYYYAELLHKKGSDSQVLTLTDLPPDFTVSALYENSGSNNTFNRLRDRIGKTGIRYLSANVSNIIHLA